MKQPVYCSNCCFNSCAEQSHKGNVRRATAEEQLKQKVVQLSEPSSTSQLLISPGLSCGSSSTSPPPDLVWTRKYANDCPTLRESPAHFPPLDLAWTLCTQTPSSGLRHPSIIGLEKLCKNNKQTNKQKHTFRPDLDDSGLWCVSNVGGYKRNA